MAAVPKLTAVRPDLRVELWFDIEGGSYAAQATFRDREGQRPIFSGDTAEAALGLCYWYWTGAGRIDHRGDDTPRCAI